MIPCCASGAYICCVHETVLQLILFKIAISCCSTYLVHAPQQRRLGNMIDIQLIFYTNEQLLTCTVLIKQLVYHLMLDATESVILTK